MRELLTAMAVCSLFMIGCATETAEETTKSTDDAATTGGDHVPEQADAAETFALSGDNTQVLFTGTKKSGDSHSGGFKTLSGTIALGDEGITAINVVIETGSLYSDADRLTGHLKNEDFFSAPEFPELKFESTKIEGNGEVTVTGTLTMHGQTGEISFPATVGVNDGSVTLNSGFKVDRTKFGMNYTGKPDDPINADVDIKIIVGTAAASAE